MTLNKLTLFKAQTRNGAKGCFLQLQEEGIKVARLQYKHWVFQSGQFHVVLNKLEVETDQGTRNRIVAGTKYNCAYHQEAIHSDEPT